MPSVDSLAYRCYTFNQYEEINVGFSRIRGVSWHLKLCDA